MIGTTDIARSDSIPPAARREGGARRAAVEERLPAISPWLLHRFNRFNRWYLRRNFHAVRLLDAGAMPDLAGRPVIFYCNHPSWWDPLICLAAADILFGDRRHYGPIDAAALKRYRVFGKLGFFGVEQDSRRGSAVFLRTARSILADPGRALWITPEGGFTDPRDRPARLRPGIAHLVRRLETCAVVPMAIEYPFWQERFPEALLAFGKPLCAARDRGARVQGTLDLLARRLESTMDALACASRARDGSRFSTLIDGSVGVGGFYDWPRRIWALLRRERFDPSHGGRP